MTQISLRPRTVVLLATFVALTAAGGVMKLSADARPAPPSLKGVVPKSADGHFWADAEVNGSRVRFLVDTGSSAVTLTPEDARRAGVDLTRLRYDRPVFTAAGDQNAAAVVLDHIDVSGARIERVSALVMRHGLSTSLLGMSYLGRLSSFSATPLALALRP